MKSHTNKATAAGLLIALGIVFGDIGTSPLYVFNAIIGNRLVSPELILGTLSCIIWTLTLQTTIKYVVLILRADNRGEGGTFALYALVRRRRKWLVIPAMIGGAALMADDRNFQTEDPRQYYSLDNLRGTLEITRTFPCPRPCHKE